MLIYVVIDLVIIGLGLMTYQKTNKSWALAFSFGLLLLFAGLRGAFTEDYQSYADYFLKTKYQVSLLHILHPASGYSMEKGFVLLLRLIGYLTSSPVVLFTIISAMTLIPYFAGFRKLSVMPMLSVLLFVGVGDYYATFNLVRQTLAAAVGFMGIVYLSERRKLRFFLCMAMAVMLHRTSLVLLPLCFILNMKVNARNVLAMCACGAAAYVLLPKIVQYFQSVFVMYENYSYGMGTGTINAVIPSLGMLLFVAYSILLGNCEFDLTDRKNRMMVNGAILTTLMLVLGMRIYIVSRLAYYLKPALWILIPNVIAGYRDERERRIILIAISVISIAYSYITLSGTGYDPYYIAIG